LHLKVVVDIKRRGKRHTLDETAISPSPLRATITLVIKSGIDVPAANIAKQLVTRIN
jgi:hypothetical protein